MASVEPGPRTRAPETALLRTRLRRAVPGLLHLHGPPGVGKTELLRAALRGHPGPRLHMDLAPLEEAALLSALEVEAGAVLEDFPLPSRPDLLPLPGQGARWARLLEGILTELSRGDAPGVLVLDGFDALLRARRRIAGELAEVWERIARRGLPVHLVLATRGRGLPPPFRSFGVEGVAPAEGEGDDALLAASLAVGPIPFRAAGWAHGAHDAVDAFRRWTVFGDHPAHVPHGQTRLRPSGAEESLQAAVVRRMLTPGGDLFDAPLRRLSAVVNAPARYAGILGAVSRADRDWAGLVAFLGAGRGSDLAPYIQRLEADGFLDVRLPLEAPEGARRRRYAPADPFLSFWFGHVLPLRSRLLRDEPGRVWREAIEPVLAEHFDRWLPEVARRWLGAHAPERLPAPARVAGAIWGEEGEVEIVGRLTNGQVCYGVHQRGSGAAGPELMEEARERMSGTRYGIGRQARAPILFLQGESDAALRRAVAREPLAALISPSDLMGATAPW